MDTFRGSPVLDEGPDEERSGVRIEGCGYNVDSEPTRTPRYGLASSTYSGCY